MKFPAGHETNAKYADAYITGSGRGFNGFIGCSIDIIAPLFYQGVIDHCFIIQENHCCLAIDHAVVLIIQGTYYLRNHCVLIIQGAT